MEIDSLYGDGTPMIYRNFYPQCGGALLIGTCSKGKEKREVVQKLSANFSLLDRSSVKSGERIAIEWLAKGSAFISEHTDCRGFNQDICFRRIWYASAGTGDVASLRNIRTNFV